MYATFQNAYGYIRNFVDVGLGYGYTEIEAVFSHFQRHSTELRIGAKLVLSNVAGGARKTNPVSTRERALTANYGSLISRPSLRIGLNYPKNADKTLLPTHIANVPSRTTYPLNGAEKQALNTAPKYVKQMTFAINSVSMELHEHSKTVHGLKDLLLAQNRFIKALSRCWQRLKSVTHGQVTARASDSTSVNA